MRKERFKEHLVGLNRTRVGIHENPRSSLFLHRNERVIPYDDHTIRLLQERLSKLPVHYYPDLEVFYQKLAEWLSVGVNNLYVSEGVSGAIKSIIETIAGPGDNIVFPSPTFALYPVYSRMFDLECRSVGYTDDLKLDMDKFYKTIDGNTAIVFLPNPNIPIEGTLSVHDISALAKHCSAKGSFLAMDEVYYGFGGPTAIGLMNQYDNIFIMRSFSKAFGLAGIRLGYVVGSEENVGYISKTRTGYETNAVSAEIASFFIDNYAVVDNYIASVKEGSAYLKAEFDAMGLEYSGGTASNFIFVRMTDPEIVRQLDIYMKSKNIHIRAGWPPPFDSGFCVTMGPRECMEAFIKELKCFLNRKVMV